MRTCAYDRDSAAWTRCTRSRRKFSRRFPTRGGWRTSTSWPTVRAHQRQVLRDIGLADAHLFGQTRNLARTVGQEVDVLQPPRVGKRLENFRLERVDLVHAVQCSSYAQVRIGTGDPTTRAERHLSSNTRVDASPTVTCWNRPLR